MSRHAYVLDPRDPRAPSVEDWAKMTAQERAAVVAQLPSEVPREGAPEGDEHLHPRLRALEALREYFRRQGRRVYLSGDLPVYYPSEPMFAPDVFAVLDVEPHPRSRWAVSHEGKGLDFALEVTLAGDRRKDLETNVEFYARLGIPEYFVLDLKLRRLLGYRLGASGAYEPIVPQAGRWTSQVLGLDLAMELGHVRFFAGSAALPHSEELIVRLEGMLGDLVAKEQALADELDAASRDAARASALAEQEKMRTEQEKARAEGEKARAEREKARAERLAARLRALGVDDEPEDE